MSKKKVRKDDSKKEFQYSKELQGLLLILIGVIGIVSRDPLEFNFQIFAIY
jgi:hypothetical protein